MKDARPLSNFQNMELKGPDSEFFLRMQFAAGAECPGTGRLGTAHIVWEVGVLVCTLPRLKANVLAAFT